MLLEYGSKMAVQLCRECLDEQEGAHICCQRFRSYKEPKPVSYKCNIHNRIYNSINDPTTSYYGSLKLNHTYNHILTQCKNTKCKCEIKQ